MWVFRLLVPVTILMCLASAQEYQHHVCFDANYTSNSIYKKNLNALLSSLSSNKDIDYGFYNFSEGDGFDRAYAIALCRGDIGQTACQRCVRFSTADLPRMCPTQEEAIVWYDNCMLRYSSHSIYQSLERYALFIWNVNNVSDVNLFNHALDGLLSRLREEASSGDSRHKFAVGSTNYTNFTKIYGLVQCTPDLTQVQCSFCLNASFREITGALFGKVGGRVLGPSCNFRYEIDQFYEIPPPPPPPLNRTAIVPPTGEGSDKVRNIIIGIVSTLCIVMLIICIFIFLKVRKRKAKGQHNFLLTDAHDITSTESLQFKFETIQVATDNFKKDHKLGQGQTG